jgi:hypothetical protein
MKKKITERALIGRINRKLASESQVLKKNRVDSQWINDLGYFYLVDFQRNTIEADHIDLPTLAKEIGVLADFEELVSI